MSERKIRNDNFETLHLRDQVTPNMQATYTWLRKAGFMTERPDVILFLDDHRGIYIPRDFAQSIDRTRIAGIEASDLDFLINEPDADHYWDVWSEVCDNARVTGTDGTVYTLYQDGALWLIPEGMDYDERTDSWFWATPIRVSLSCSDEDDGTVTIYCEDQRQARLDQSVSVDGQSSRWECPRDMDVAYASLCNFYDLERALTDAGYEVDASEYSPPDDEDLAYWAYRVAAAEAGDEVLDRDAWLEVSNVR